MGLCHGKSALGEGDTLAHRKPHHNKSKWSFKKRSSSRREPRPELHTYPVDVPIIIKPRVNGHSHGHVAVKPERIQREEEYSADSPRDIYIIPDFPSYGPETSRTDSCDPDTPQPDDADSSPSHQGDSPELDSPLDSDPKPLPTTDSGICSLSQSSPTTPTAVSSPLSETSPHKDAVEEAKARFLWSSSVSTPDAIPENGVSSGWEDSGLDPTLLKDTRAHYTICTQCKSASAGSLDYISEDHSEPVPPSKLAVKRFLKHQGLPPRPRSETRFSFTGFRKRKSADRLGSRGSWRSEDSFDLSASMKTGLSYTGSESSEMCLCEELLDIQAPLAKFDSILTVNAPSCGNLNRLPHVCPASEHYRSAGAVSERSPRVQNTCVNCMGNNSNDSLDAIHINHKEIHSHLEECSTSRRSSVETDTPIPEDPRDPRCFMVDGQEMVILDLDTYNKLLKDLAEVKVKLQWIYDMLLQVEFDSISDIVTSSGLENCLADLSTTQNMNMVWTSSNSREATDNRVTGIQGR